MPRFPMMYSSDNHRNRMNGGGDSFKYSANGDTLEDGSHMSVSDMKTDDISFDHEGQVIFMYQYALEFSITCRIFKFTFPLNCH